MGNTMNGMYTTTVNELSNWNPDTPDEHSRFITELCYEMIQEAFVANGFLLWEFPCGCYPPVPLGSGVTMRGIYWRKMNVLTPFEVKHLWEYSQW